MKALGLWNRGGAVAMITEFTLTFDTQLVKTENTISVGHCALPLGKALLPKSFSSSVIVSVERESVITIDYNYVKIVSGFRLIPFQHQVTVHV